MSQLLASGEVMLDDDMRNPRESAPGVTKIGYRDSNYVYLLPEVAYREANRVQSLRFTVTAIGSQLREDGCLVTANGDSHLTVQVRIRGNRTRVWRLRADILSGDSGDDGDSDPEPHK